MAAAVVLVKFPVAGKLFFLLFVESFRLRVWMPSFFIVIGRTDWTIGRRGQVGSLLVSRIYKG